MHQQSKLQGALVFDLGTVRNPCEDKSMQIRCQLSGGQRAKQNKTLNYISDALTVGGMTPAYGALADAANIVFATGRTVGNAVSDTYYGLKTGDFDYGLTGKAAKDIAWGAAGLVPIAGQFASGAKLGSKTLKNAKLLKNSKLLKGIDAFHHTKVYKPLKAGKLTYKNLPEEFKS